MDDPGQNRWWHDVRRSRPLGSCTSGTALSLVLAVSILTFVGPARAAKRVRVAVGSCVLEAPAAYQAELDLLASRAASILPELERDLGVRAAAPYRIVLIPPGKLTDPEIARLNALAPPWAAGFLIARARVGAIRLALVHRYPYDDFPSVLVHEATHMLLHDAAGDNLPRWFEEGLATWEARRWGLRDVLILSSSVLARGLPSLAELEDGFSASAGQARLSYAASFEFVSWSIREYGDDFVAKVLAGAGARPFVDVWETAAGVSLEDSEADWRQGTLFLYRLVPLISGPGTLWLAITLLALVAAVRRRQRSRRIYAQWDQWEREEQEEDPDEEDDSGRGNPHSADEWVH